MKMKRRAFLRKSVFGAGGLLVTGVPATAARVAPDGQFDTLDGALAAAGFKPRDPGSFTVVWLADVHYGIGKPEEILTPIWPEIHRMDPRPAFVGIAGDLIVKASRRFGDVPSPDQREEAVAEFRQVKQALQGLDPKIPVKLALGNHDTYPGEEGAGLFHSVFPREEHPEYHAFTVKEVPFIFLNGGSSGFLDQVQRHWFTRTARELHRPGGTLVTVCHQPSLGSVVSERGVSQAYRECLPGVSGDLWLIGGHEHRNETACFRLPGSPGTALAEATITAGNPATWGTGHPGYWVYGFTNGRLVARIFRGRAAGYLLAPPPSRVEAKPVLLPFEGREEEIRWKVLVGEGDTPYFLGGKAAWCLNYWHYVEHLTYRFPLALAGGKARHLIVLSSPSGKESPRYLIGPDPERVHEVPAPERDGSYTRLPIPAMCAAAGQVVVRLENCVVSGFALAS